VFGCSLVEPEILEPNWMMRGEWILHGHGYVWLCCLVDDAGKCLRAPKAPKPAAGAAPGVFVKGKQRFSTFSGPFWAPQ
jgi:hypothetical protein